MMPACIRDLVRVIDRLGIIIVRIARDVDRFSRFKSEIDNGKSIAVFLFIIL